MGMKGIGASTISTQIKNPSKNERGRIMRKNTESHHDWEDFDFEEYHEPRRCDTSCPHFDILNQCCWLITDKTPGLFTYVSEGDCCIHGFKEDY